MVVVAAVAVAVVVIVVVAVAAGVTLGAAGAKRGGEEEQEAQYILVPLKHQNLIRWILTQKGLIRITLTATLVEP